MKKIVCCVVGLLTGLFLASNVHAVPFSGTSAAIFNNPVGDPGLVKTGVGTSHFTWGDQDSFGTGPNSLSFTGLAFTSIPPGTEFDFGTLTYFNGTTVEGTNATGVDLVATLTFTDPASLASQSFTFDFKLFSTPNTGTPTENADNLVLNNPTDPTKSFTYDGNVYTLEFTRFGNLLPGSGGSITGGNTFNVLEGATASADLFGKITTPPQAVPEPATMLLLGSGLIGLWGARKKFKK